MLATWAVCGFWDWLLYFSPARHRLAAYKITPAYPPTSQYLHDAAYTSLASLLASCLEGGLCYLWASGSLTYSGLEEAPATNLLVAVTVSLWRSPHFYVVHRMMHPWRWLVTVVNLLYHTHQDSRCP